MPVYDYSLQALLLTCIKFISLDNSTSLNLIKLMQFILLTFPFEWVSFSWKSVYLDFNVKMDWYTLFLQPHCTYITCKMRWLSKLNNMATFCTFTIIGLEVLKMPLVLLFLLLVWPIAWFFGNNEKTLLFAKKEKKELKWLHLHARYIWEVPG